MNSLSEKLAATINERLILEKLLSRPDAKKMLSKLAQGTLSPEDWRRLIDPRPSSKAKS